MDFLLIPQVSALDRLLPSDRLAAFIDKPKTNDSLEIIKFLLDDSISNKAKWRTNRVWATWPPPSRVAA